MSSFGSAAFKVYPDNGRWPLPSHDSDGTAHYRADVALESAAAYAALADALCLVTVKRALGSFAVAVQVDAGPGSDTLTVPTRLGTAQAFTAVLVGFTPQASGRVVEQYKASCDWVILSEVTP